MPWAGVTQVCESHRPRSSGAGPESVSVTRSITKATKPPLKLFEETAVKVGNISQPSMSSAPPLQKSVTTGSSLKKDEDFVRLLRHNIEDAQIVLMLAIIPNLSRLSINGMSTYPTLDWYQFLSRSDNTLRNLRDFDIRGAMPRHYGSLHTTTLGFLKLTPDLEHLHLSHVNIEGSRQRSEFFTGKKLQYFFAPETQVNRQILQSLLSRHKVEHFHYKPGIGELTEEIQARFSEDHIIGCLESSKESLLNLTLCSTTQSRAPTMSQFRKLDTLQMPYQGGFFGNVEESDPKNLAATIRKRISAPLRTLKLRYIQPNDDITVPMEILMNLKVQGELPELMTVRLTFTHYVRSPWLPPGAMVFDDMVPKWEAKLDVMFRQAGLKLELAQTD